MTSRRAAGSTPDAAAPPFVPSAPRRRRRIIVFAAIGLVTYLLSLLATTPARLFVPPSPGISAVGGTIWHGEAALVGGNRLEWRWAPLRSISGLGFAVDWRVTGAATDLGGRALLRRSGVRFDRVSGRADGSLLAAVAPDLPFRCDLLIQANLPLLAIGDKQRVEGMLRSEPGSCSSGGAIAPLPPLVAASRASGGGRSALRLMAVGQPGRLLAELVLREEGALDLRVTPAGAALMPFLLPPGGTRIRTAI
jgi:hypothetical protein